MLTLAFDTTGEFGSIALADENGVRAEALVHAPEGFGQVLFPRVQALLEAESASLRDIELLAAASGPGSFTGVRVGLAAIQVALNVGATPVALTRTSAKAAELKDLGAAHVIATASPAPSAIRGASGPMTRPMPIEIRPAKMIPGSSIG